MTKIVKAPPAADVKKLAEQKREATELKAFLAERPCETPEEEAWFSSTLSSVRGLHKALEDQRTAITKPILASKAAVDALFAPVTKPLKECEGVIRQKLADAARIRFQAEREARQLAEVAAAQGRHEDVLEALASAPVHVPTSGSSARMVWVAIVEDFSALPDAFKLPNEAALAAAGKTAGTGQPDAIPGVAWVLDAAVRAK